MDAPGIILVPAQLSRVAAPSRAPEDLLGAWPRQCCPSWLQGLCSETFGNGQALPRAWSVLSRSHRARSRGRRLVRGLSWRQCTWGCSGCGSVCKSATDCPSQNEGMVTTRWLLMCSKGQSGLCIGFAKITRISVYAHDQIQLPSPAMIQFAFSITLISHVN